MAKRDKAAKRIRDQERFDIVTAIQLAHSKGKTIKSQCDLHGIKKWHYQNWRRDIERKKLKEKSDDTGTAAN